jgi:hypothetical protein
MQECQPLCDLPERFDSLPLAEQAKLMIRCRIKDETEHRLCSERQRALSDWIRRE